MQVLNMGLSKGLPYFFNRERIPFYNEELKKTISTAQNLVWYDLESIAKMLFPVITPFRNKIPRVSGDGGKATNWKAITGINTTRISAGLSEGKRNAALNLSTKDYTRKYKGLGYDSYVTWEADYAAKNFDDVKQRNYESTLSSLMIAEERVILGGNGDRLLGTTPTPSLVPLGTGGVLINGTTYYVGCVALTLEGDYFATVASGIYQAISRTSITGNVDTFGGGSAAKSAAASIATPAGPDTCSIEASVTSVRGATSYAWYIGTAAGAMYLTKITTVNKYTFTGEEVPGTQLFSDLDANDHSTNEYVFDGLLTQISETDSGSYVHSLDGATLTSDGAGGIVEIDDAFEWFWDNFRLSPSIIWGSGRTIKDIQRKTIAAGGAPLLRYNMDVAGGKSIENMNITSGAIVGFLTNIFAKSGGQIVKLEIHPDIPNGVLLFECEGALFNYPYLKVANLMQMKLRRDYHAIDWPWRERQFEYGIYMDGLLQNYFLPAFGVLQNIGY